MLMSTSETFEIHFGDPSKPVGYLRDVLAKHIIAVPSGGAIDWVTYYFRDVRLAELLLQAHKRGVRVTVSLPATPRISVANQAVIKMLSGPDRLADGLKVVNFPGIPAPPGRAWKPQLHEKIYCFSHPKPIALVGSYNPSGNNPEAQPEIIREIGDQDHGYNVLAGIVEPSLVQHIIAHVRRIHQAPPSLFYRFTDSANRVFKSSDTTIHFLPSLQPHPVVQFLNQLGSGAHVRIAASHIRATNAVNVMIELARRGAAVEIIAESTRRRVTPDVEQRLIDAGIRFSRADIPGGAPMHLKFVLIENSGQVWSIFGSFNWTKPSFWLNHEIIVITSNPSIFNQFSNCWNTLKKEAAMSAEQKDFIIHPL
ncbi:MAG: phospholipase D-like domain-containing protein [Nitrosomonas sp.]|nr:phospholipase D-like domain-containing protein [Nitrosomonas sp.]